MWNLYHDGGLVPPLVYSDGRTQEDVVDDIIDAFKTHRVVVLHGSVGTGKSAIALNVVSAYSRGGIIVVPTKMLEEQYRKDYANKGAYQILRDDKRPLTISVIKGRGNFRCRLTNTSCKNKTLPCVRALKDGEKRAEVAFTCPYYSPITYKRACKKMAEKFGGECECCYEDIAGNIRCIFTRDERRMCRYYGQFRGYYDDVVMMNSAIYLIETLITGRKPLKDVEVIDECDFFLDNLTFTEKVSKRRIEKITKDVNKLGLEGLPLIRDCNELISTFNKATIQSYRGVARDVDIDVLKKLTHILTELSGREELGEESNLSLLLRYANHLYVDVDSLNPSITYFIPDMRVMVSKILKRATKRILLMSATPHNSEVLKNVFGLSDFAMVYGEVKHQGEIRLCKTQQEEVISHTKWQSFGFREKMHQALSEILKKATPPTLIQVHAYKYLQDGMRELLKKRKVVILKNGEMNATFSTTMTRGIDLKDDKCRSIVLLKCPYPNLQSPILQSMKEFVGEEAFWQYYHNIMMRNLIQYVGRGLRHKDDWVEVWSPDRLVHTFLLKYWRGKITVFEKSNEHQMF